jgi:hypothetical protein
MLFVAYDPQNLGDHEPLPRRDQGGGLHAGDQHAAAQISKEKRDALITRAIHVYRSMTEKNRPPALIAQHVVDSVLSAIE